MLLRLAVKELRETAWIALVALAVYLYFAARAIGIGLAPWHSWNPRASIPFVSGGFLGAFTMVAICLAIALGFRQSAVESGRGTFLFLLHRPVSRTALIGTKLLVGAGLFLVCSAVPILIFTAWAATPGTHASPFEWSMTAATWKVWGTITALYLGAFLSGIRPARWFGTRLLPLAAAGVLVAGISVLPWWPISGLPALALLGVVLVSSILFVARTRDFS